MKHKQRLIPTWKISEKEVLEQFSFLQSDFNFPKFTKVWLKDEYSITTKKGDIEFSCLIFQFSSDSPLLGLINHSIPFEFDSSSIYPTNYYHIEDFDSSGEIKKLSHRGREKINDYVKNCANLLSKKLNKDI